MNILITGASSGIGRSLFEHFSGKLDTRAIGVSRTGKHPYPTHWRMDVRLITKDIIKDIKNTHKIDRFDVLLNVAGIMPFKETKEVMDVNFWAAYNLMNIMHEQNRNIVIINITSVAALRPDTQFPIYSASKAALEVVSKTCAKAWAPDARVMTIAPGFYDTALVPEKTPYELIETIPLGFEDHPDNLIPLVELMLANKYMTGNCIVVDGGVSL